MTSLVLTVTETLRYRGRLGQWSWVLHRVAGIGTLIFVILHIVDTSWATFFPDLYAKTIAAYATPLFSAGEFALVACVVFHAFHGIRIAIFDWRPRLWRYQAAAARIILLLTVLILVPTFLAMTGHLMEYYNDHTFELGIEKVVDSQVPFALGTVVILAAALVASAALSVVPGIGGQKKAQKTYKRSRFDTFMWSYMRVSGVLILPLVFGHLAMVHVIQSVFFISQAGIVPVGTTLGPNIIQNGLTAANFVALRWNTSILTGLFIWRVYDVLMLALIIVHGFNGARYVVNDYIHDRWINRAVRLALIGTAVGLLIVGGLAIIQAAQPTTAAPVSQVAAPK
jgi:succinate dehydrogenase / fumarate reductase cytochrome b subunit